MRSILAFLALVALAGCQGESEQPARQLPPDVQRELPLDLSLGNLCPGAETPAYLLPGLERSARALVRELRARPDWLVTYTFHTEEEGPIVEEITVRELAEIELDGMQGEPGETLCRPDLQRRIADALG